MLDIIHSLHARLVALETRLGVPADEPRVFSTDIRAFFVRHCHDVILFSMRLYDGDGDLFEEHHNDRVLSTAADAEALINYLRWDEWVQNEQNFIRLTTPGDSLDSRMYITLLTDVDRHNEAMCALRYRARQDRYVRQIGATPPRLHLPR